MIELPNQWLLRCRRNSCILLLYNENQILAHSGLSCPADIKRHVSGDMRTPARALYSRTQKSLLLIMLIVHPEWNGQPERHHCCPTGRRRQQRSVTTNNRYIVVLLSCQYHPLLLASVFCSYLSTVNIYRCLSTALPLAFSTLLLSPPPPCCCAPRAAPHRPTTSTPAGNKHSISAQRLVVRLQCRPTLDGGYCGKGHVGFRLVDHRGVVNRRGGVR